MANAFGLPIPEPGALLNHSAAASAVREALDTLLFQLGGGRAQELWLTCIECIERARDRAELEAALKRVLQQAPGFGCRDSLFGGRAELILRQIDGWVTSPRMLDLGCGDGLVGTAFASTHEVTLADVLDYRDNDALHLPWARLTDGEQLPFDTGTFDAVLLLTVLHHSADPEHLLREACRVTRGRVIVIESVVGVHDAEIQHFGGAEKASVERLSQRFATLDTDGQYAYASFVDFFYNRCLHEGVPVPLSFNSPDAWRFLFERTGMRELHRAYLGVDQPIVPEFHTLHIFETADH